MNYIYYVKDPRTQVITSTNSAEKFKSMLRGLFEKYPNTDVSCWADHVAERRDDGERDADTSKDNPIAVTTSARGAGRKSRDGTLL